MLRHAYLREKRIDEVTQISGERTVYYERARLRSNENGTIVWPLPVERPKSAEIPTTTAWQRFTTWRNKSSNRQTFEAWLILTPILIYYFFFNIIPIGLNIFASLTSWRGAFVAPEWVGLANYARYLQQPYPLIMFNTALFAI